MPNSSADIKSTIKETKMKEPIVAFLIFVICPPRSRIRNIPSNISILKIPFIKKS